MGPGSEELFPCGALTARNDEERQQAQAALAEKQAQAAASVQRVEMAREAARERCGLRARGGDARDAHPRGPRRGFS